MSTDWREQVVDHVRDDPSGLVNASLDGDAFVALVQGAVAANRE